MIGQEQDSLGGELNPNQAFAGSLDDICIFNRVLNQTEIQFLMDNSPASDTSLILHYSFDSGSPKDLSGNGNDAVSMGGVVIE